MMRLNQSADAKPRSRSYKWVSFPKQEEIIKEIFGTIEDQKAHQGETVIMLSGPRGMGKSLLGRELAHRAHERFDSATPAPGHVNRPVLRAILGSGAGFASVAVDVRHFQGLPVPTSHYRVAHIKVGETCQRQSTVCIFIDRFDMILDQGPVTQRDAFKAIGYLASAAKVPIVLCGSFDPGKVFSKVNDTHGFVGERAMYLELPRFDLDVNFMGAIRSIGRAYNAPEPDALLEPDIAHRLYELSGGITGHLVRGLVRSLRKAAEAGSNTLKIANIEDGFSVYRRSGDRKADVL